MMAIGSNIAFMGLMAAAGTPLIIAGGLDLSVAAIAGLVGVLLAVLHGDVGINIWIAALAALVLGAFIGSINGLFATRLKLNPLIVTLGMMSIVSGAALILTGGLTKPLMVPGFNWIGSGRVFDIPVPPILMIIDLHRAFDRASPHALRPLRLCVGRECRSEPADRPPGRAGADDPLHHLRRERRGRRHHARRHARRGRADAAAAPHLLTVIAAIILGGTSLYGGRGSVWGTLLAVLILGTLNNGLTLLDVSSFWQDVTRGIVLVAAVSLDQIRTRALGD